MFRRLKNCHNVEDLRLLAKQRLPGPIFHYIDGAADDEVTYRRNTSAFDDCDLVPNVLAGVENIDMSVTVMGQKLAMPVFCSPTALQRLFHHDGERAVARAAEKFGTMFGVSALGTVALKEIGDMISTPKLFQFYFHKDRGLNDAMVERAQEAGFNALALTVDTITGGNRERDLYTGFTSPPRLSLRSLMSFAVHPRWALNYFFREAFELAELKDFVQQGSNVAVSIGDYFAEMLDQSMNWADAETLRAKWNGPFCLKGVMSVADAQKAVDIGADAIMVSNHGGRQLDGSRSPFDQISEISDAVGDKIDVILDGGVRRGTHVLKAIAAGAKACSGGRMYLYSLAAAGQPGVEKALQNLRTEIERDMKLLGVTNIAQIDRTMLRYR
ncbi:alpha-hydroxy-acid oxidizing protein [Gammaproteobacteria bacterium]|nr:alpha-hydroxy-acid oxidizing enzyme [Gammaproteobacteria bacterium]MAX08040.1 alpha-hydroxy-acid oxidizing enzyme [Gammaproteobacteria bacterium]MDC0221565.1 alpha-hydroxy-acid oxidizing protein [Gammaproteobacteria bacterium]